MPHSGLRMKSKNSIPKSSRALVAALVVASGFIALGFASKTDSAQQLIPETSRAQISADLLVGTASMATRTALTQPPVIFNQAPETPALHGAIVDGTSVGSHPTIHPSPIATASVLIEPAGHFRRTVVPGVPLQCDRFRSLVRQIGDWDPDVVLAFVWRESLCRESALSSTNDWGLMQINATCWAGKGNDGLPSARNLPDEIESIDLQCDGISQATSTAKWCFFAKEEAVRTGRRPNSPCDAWLEPETNIEAAYEIWRIQGWQAWCFDTVSRATPACKAVAQSL